MGPLGLIFALGAVNGLLLGALILTGRANPLANRCLSGLVALVSLRLTIYVLGFAGMYDAHPALTFAPLDVSASFGPLLYLYVVALTRGAVPRLALHLAPAAVQFLYGLICFALPMPIKWDWYAGGHLHVVEPSAMTLILCQAAGYLVAAWRRYARYQEWLDERVAKREAWRLGWLRVMILAFAMALGLTVVAGLWNALIFPLDYYGRVPAMLGCAALAYALGLLGWRHGDERYPVETDFLADEVEPARRVDYADLARQWRERVARAGWWREEGLSLADLAGRLGVSERTLSRGLRDGAGENFNGFVNALRVEAVQRAMREDAADDLLDLALASGFASKASFNRAFRRVTGTTPSAWRRTCREAAQIPPIGEPSAI